MTPPIPRTSRSPAIPDRRDLRCRWGGPRAGAGRPKKPGAGLPHRSRPALASRFPVHLGLKVDPTLPSLRRPTVRRVIEGCFRAGKMRLGFRLVHYSIQHHHLHLIAEASERDALARGVKGLAVRLAKGINRLLGRRGRVFIDRYFQRVLRSPREVHHCLRYVLLNEARHAAQHGTTGLCGGVDPCSSGRYFDGWRSGPPRGPPADQEPPVASARTYLLRQAWRRHGLLDVDEIPGIRRSGPGAKRHDLLIAARPSQ